MSLFRKPSEINIEDYVIATYYLETPMKIEEAAEALAAEQSSGTWQRVGYETDELREKHAAKVLDIKVLEKNIESPSLPSAIKMEEFASPSGDVEYNVAILKIAFPHINFGPKMPNLFTAVAGNVFEMAAFTAIKLLDLEFPKTYLKEFKGPRFGIKGTRDVLGVYERPLVGAIIKPCVGLSPDDLAQLAYEGAKGGLDFIKDDEPIANTKYSTLKERSKKVMAALRRAEEETDEKTMYAFNLTDRVDRIKELHDIVVENGANCVMINVATAGISAMRVLAEYSEVPIHCHRDFAPAWSRSQYVGINAQLLTKLFRLAGADQIHIGAIAGKLYESDEEVLKSIEECTNDLGDITLSLPVSSGGQWAGKTPVNLRKIGHSDFLHLSGGGIYAHPGGAEAGARSVRQAWDATIKGIKLEEYAKEKEELATAIRHYGKVLY